MPEVAQGVPISRLFESADTALRVGEWGKAREGYEAILAMAPGDGDARAGLDFVDYLERGGRKSKFYIPIDPIPEETFRARLANKDLNVAESRAGAVRLESRPTTCHIEHTTRCNFYCPHCSKGYEPYPAVDLPADLVDRALDALLPTILTANLTGFGEPTIGSRYARIMKRLTEGGVQPQFNTNTSTLTLPHIELLVRSRAQVSLSIDGATKETFETIRAGGNWEHLMQVLHWIKRLRAVYRTPCWFGITFVAMRMNIHELPDMVRLAHRFDIDQLLVQDFFPIGKEFDDQSLRSEPERANRFFDEAEETAKDLGQELILPPRYEVGGSSPTVSGWKKFLATKGLLPKPNRFPQGCDHPWKDFRVKFDGEITPCCHSSRPLGDLRKQTFEEIWNGRRYRFFRWRIKTAVPPMECRTCHVFEGINRGNPGNTMLQEGKLLKVLYKLETLLDRLVKRYRTRKKPAVTRTYFRGKYWKPNEGSEKSPERT